MRYVSLVTSACMLASACATLPASAGNRYDGTWSVAAVTERGECAAAYAWSVAVINSHISDAGPFVQSAGFVNGRGSITLRVTHGSDVLAAAGAIRGATATGTWRSTTSQCAGRWNAVKSW